MKINKLMLFTIFVVTAILLSGCSSSSNNGSFASQAMVRWDGVIYTGTQEMVHEIQDELGRIEYYITDETQSNKNRSSNFYKEGTMVYKIKDIDVNDAVAIEFDNNGYVKAIVIRE